MLTTRNIIFTFIGMLFFITEALANFSNNSEAREFINQMQKKHGFEVNYLENLLNKAQLKLDIIAAISKPAESKPWYKYRPIFLTSSRIEGGVEFMHKYYDDLQRAELEFGVPKEIIVAILGVETRYGNYKGNYAVLDSLATLAFEYPKRAKFFKQELEHYLLLTREEKFAPESIKGSYAGAMGFPQFIASSYRNYAIDFSGDGKRDLINNPVDAIGSIANYFHKHGWQKSKPIAYKADFRKGENLPDSSDIKPKFTVGHWQNLGFKAEDKTLNKEKAALIALEQEDGREYWLGLDNFYVITRYNHSPLYAMAVFQLSEQIKTAYLTSLKSPSEKLAGNL